MNVTSNRTLAPVRLRPAPAASTSHMAPAPVKATATEPMPRFSSPEAYQAHVLKLVAVAQDTHRALEMARQAYQAGGASRADVRALAKRLDAVKQQLALLRDQYPMPSSWTRPKWLFGEGFDKAQFWREQVEAIPGKKFDADRFQAKLSEALAVPKEIDDPYDRDKAFIKALKEALPFAGSLADIETVMRHGKKLSYYYDTIDAVANAAAERGVALVRTPDEALALSKAIQEYDHQADLCERSVAMVLRRGSECATSFPDVIRLMNAAWDGVSYNTTRDELLGVLATRGLAFAETFEECIAITDVTSEHAWYRGEEEFEAVKPVLEKALALATTPAQIETLITTANRQYRFHFYWSYRDDLIQRAKERASSF